MDYDGWYVQKDVISIAVSPKYLETELLSYIVFGVSLSICLYYVFSSAIWFKKQQGHGFFSLTYFTDRFIFAKICCVILNLLLLNNVLFYPSEHIYRISLTENNKGIFKVIFYEKRLSFEGVQGIIMLINVKSLKSICILYDQSRSIFISDSRQLFSIP